MFCGLGNCGKDSPHRMLIKTMGEDNGRVKKFSHFHFSTFTCKECQSSQCGRDKMRVKKPLRWHHFHLRFSLSQDYLTTWNERYSVGIARVTMIYLKWQQERLLSPSSYQSIKLFFQSFRTFFKRGEFWFILDCNILNFRKENVPVSPGGEFTYTQLPQLTWINMIQGQHSQAWTCQVPQPTCFWTRPGMDKTDVNLFEYIACIQNGKSQITTSLGIVGIQKKYLKANTTPKNNNDCLWDWKDSNDNR